MKSLGFEINPYDWCVANATINNKQCTICWHVDDLKISHMDPDVTTSIIKKLEAVFAKDAPLTIQRGKELDYLGMDLDFGEKGKVGIGMAKSIKAMLQDMPEDMNGWANTPAATHLFETNEDAKKLTEKEAQFFHTTTAKMLFMCKRARPDIQTAVSFLCTRVKEPDCDDYKKLRRVIRYLKKTTNLVMRLQITDMTVIKWWVDASFAVHPNMRGHTGGVMMMGRGAIIATSTKQKLNTRSSTESELVGAHDVMPIAMWTKYFIEAQGYQIKQSIMYQDNKSCILMENNGRASSSKRTKHINVRYFFITDRIAKGNIEIVYCQTNDMVADFFTKPLQGKLFKKFICQIMNIELDDPILRPAQDHRSVLEKETKPSLNRMTSQFKYCFFSGMPKI